MELTPRQQAIKKFVEEHHKKKQEITVKLLSVSFEISVDKVREELAAIRKYKQTYGFFDAGGFQDIFEKIFNLN
ncbi:unnamed protein product [marine sediment metagenome]|uniref:HTH deoR-type domain-containing protein n=1 Tax=marine sediment metagenome TaxID=412755 RepID=X0WCF4_9ZZZZ